MMRYFLAALLLLFLACSSGRPDGPEAREMVEVFNHVVKAAPQGNVHEYLFLLSAASKAQFSQEVEMAISLDSAGLRALPTMQMLRVLSLRNGLDRRLLLSREYETILVMWKDAAGIGFPVQNKDRFYYTPHPELEAQMLAEGATTAHLLLVEEEGEIKVNPFHTPDYQEKRLANILAQTTLDELVQEAAWLYFQTYRPVSWVPLE